MHKLDVEWFEFGCCSEFQPESKMGEDVWVSLKTCTWYQNHGFETFQQHVVFSNMQSQNTKSYLMVVKLT